MMIFHKIPCIIQNKKASACAEVFSLRLFVSGQIRNTSNQSALNNNNPNCHHGNCGAAHYDTALFSSIIAISHLNI
jgi:hypothetical protein